MFNLITNVKKRNVVGNITLDELMHHIKNPSIVHKKIIDRARSIDKKSKEYLEIKQSLPCFVPNFNHDGYVKIATIEKSTGFLYIDVDYTLDIDFSKFDFIAASWKSLSNIGSGLLIAIEDFGTDLKSMRAMINEICNILDIKPDDCAVSRDRLNVIAYDVNAYYNPNYKVFKVNNTNIDTISNEIKVDISIKNNSNNRLLQYVHFYEGDLRFSNLSDFTEKLEFKDDELFIDLSDNPIEYTEVYIPKTIKVGERNKTMFRLISMIRGLNPAMELKRLIGVANHINNTRCYEPMEDEELLNICNKVFNNPPRLFSNKTKKYPFNPIYTLTGGQRKTIACTASRIKIGLATKERILNLAKEWNTEEDGKFTMKALAIKAGVCYKTSLRLKNDLKNLHN